MSEIPETEKTDKRRDGGDLWLEMLPIDPGWLGKETVVCTALVTPYSDASGPGVESYKRWDGT